MKRNSSMVLALGLLTLAGVYGQQVAQEGVIFSVTGSRPLAKAAEELEGRYGIPVSYEDPAYSYDGDLIDKTDPDYKKTHPGARALYPKGGSVVFRSNSAASVGSPADAIPLFQPLLDDHVRAGNPGEFTLLPNGDGVAIVPSRVRNANGILVSEQSPLEVRISFPEQERTAMEAMDAIFAAILANSGKRVMLGTHPFGGLRGTDLRGAKASYYVTSGARDEPARSVLQRTLAGLEWAHPGNKTPIPKMSWSLLYDANEKAYFLNVHGVFVNAPTPTGYTIRRPVTR